MSHIFVSHSSTDDDTVDQIVHTLETQTNRMFWVDHRAIQPGDNWQDKIEEALHRCEALLLILSHSSASSREVRAEWNEILYRGYPVYVAIIDAVEFTDIPYRLKLSEFVNLWKDWDVDIARLAQVLISQSTTSPANSSHSILEIATSLRKQLETTNKAIKLLTDDQKTVIYRSRFNKRLLIEGSAGSGKTVVAANIAARLDEVGQKTLLLCHNPHLASYIQEQYLAGTNVDIIDFTNWIYRILGKVIPVSGTIYEEPSEDDLLETLLELAKRPDEQYDAIIVDEGQDFRDYSWEIIEAALLSPQASRWYIFYDNHQSLMPRNSKFPFSEPHLELSRNCRNAGEVFDIVRQFHPQSPEISIELKNQGVVKYLKYNSNGFNYDEEYEVITSAVRESLNTLNPSELVVLTAEEGDIKDSLLNGMKITLNPKWKWQSVVHKYLGSVELSDEPFPTKQDIENVTQLAQTIVNPRRVEWLKKDGKDEWIKWRVDDNQISLSAPHLRTLLSNQAFFASPEWANGIPQPEAIEITCDPSKWENNIKLYSIASFKGLESEGILLFLPHLQHHNPKSLIYVGLSRARFLLYIVLQKSIDREYFYK